MRSVAEFLLPLAISLKNSNFSKAAKVFWLQAFCCLWSYDQKITSGKYVQETSEQYIICIITHRRGRVRCFHAELQPLFNPYFILVLFLLTESGISKSSSCAQKNRTSNDIPPARQNQYHQKSLLLPRRTNITESHSSCPEDPESQEDHSTFVSK